LLGYSEPAAFNRAFARWHNETPRAFRQRQRESAFSSNPKTSGARNRRWGAAASRRRGS
jgi:AraC-like DNA-binding protein